MAHTELKGISVSSHTKYVMIYVRLTHKRCSFVVREMLGWILMPIFAFVWVSVFHDELSKGCT
jgi:hypothetical protein